MKREIEVVLTGDFEGIADVYGDAELLKAIELDVRRTIL